LGLIVMVWIALIPLIWYQCSKTPDPKQAAAKKGLLKGVPRTAPTGAVPDLSAPPRDTLPATPPAAEKPVPPAEGEKRAETLTPGAQALLREPVPGTAVTQEKTAAPPAAEKREEFSAPPEAVPPPAAPPVKPAIPAAAKPEHAAAPAAAPTASSVLKPPSPAGQTATPADKPKPGTGNLSWVYIIRLGAFQNAANAQELQKRLQQKGYPVVIKKYEHVQKGSLYLVDLKPMRDAQEARGQLDRLQKEENVTPLLLKVAEKP
jgi:cell division septation protein DedD